MPFFRTLGEMEKSPSKIWCKAPLTRNLDSGSLCSVQDKPRLMGYVTYGTSHAVSIDSTISKSNNPFTSCLSCFSAASNATSFLPTSPYTTEFEILSFCQVGSRRSVLRSGSLETGSLLTCLPLHELSSALRMELDLAPGNPPLLDSSSPKLLEFQCRF